MPRREKTKKSHDVIRTHGVCCSASIGGKGDATERSRSAESGRSDNYSFLMSGSQGASAADAQLTRGLHNQVAKFKEAQARIKCTQEQFVQQQRY
jgi:hypothetical protein